ncbi:hypothetical protein [Stakelama tenebrarum]|uniref:Lipoprotein n=1 Tax=Stakelama tenebrarum TaxID=2711215 RepID=A0A6G6Y314_9SPHN|nr:hypothetical protein [Sphingosinithalassobacter tenebrarum]QIG79315.1 hypothetical protein G5C33_05590 [Sphingosinithalassobacter tenebrarum]
MYRAIAVSASLLFAAACAPVAGEGGSTSYSERQAQKLAAALEGMQPGETRRCIDKVRISRVEGVGGKLLFEQGRDRVYVADITGCPGASRDDLIVFETLNGSSYCEKDTVRTVSRSGGMLTGSCTLGAFTEYRRP